MFLIAMDYNLCFHSVIRRRKVFKLYPVIFGPFASAAAAIPELFVFPLIIFATLPRICFVMLFIENYYLARTDKFYIFGEITQDICFFCETVKS